MGPAHVQGCLQISHHLVIGHSLLDPPLEALDLQRVGAAEARAIDGDKPAHPARAGVLVLLGQAGRRGVQQLRAHAARPERPDERHALRQQAAAAAGAHQHVCGAQLHPLQRASSSLLAASSREEQAHKALGVDGGAHGARGKDTHRGAPGPQRLEQPIVAPADGDHVRAAAAAAAGGAAAAAPGRACAGTRRQNVQLEHGARVVLSVRRHEGVHRHRGRGDAPRVQVAQQAAQLLQAGELHAAALILAGAAGQRGRQPGERRLRVAGARYQELPRALDACGREAQALERHPDGGPALGARIGHEWRHPQRLADQQVHHAGALLPGGRNELDGQLQHAAVAQPDLKGAGGGGAHAVHNLHHRLDHLRLRQQPLRHLAARWGCEVDVRLQILPWDGAAGYGAVHRRNAVPPHRLAGPPAKVGLRRQPRGKGVAHLVTQRQQAAAGREQPRRLLWHRRMRGANQAGLHRHRTVRVAHVLDHRCDVGARVHLPQVRGGAARHLLHRQRVRHVHRAARVGRQLEDGLHGARARNGV
mmetsp:Transcript_14174/g.36379  ORF Transcript_14174/g.36379 Transcript_14174/m.36379 type:complete len:532 (-) Transcript_14174:752-2347(-)